MHEIYLFGFNFLPLCLEKEEGNNRRIFNFFQLFPFKYPSFPLQIESLKAQARCKILMKL
jgi:hypothetical protein